jgi:hypothetical protein
MKTATFAIMMQELMGSLKRKLFVNNPLIHARSIIRLV